MEGFPIGVAPLDRTADPRDSRLSVLGMGHKSRGTWGSRGCRTLSGLSCSSLVLYRACSRARNRRFGRTGSGWHDPTRRQPSVETSSLSRIKSEGITRLEP